MMSRISAGTRDSEEFPAKSVCIVAQGQKECKARKDALHQITSFGGLTKHNGS